MRTRLYDPTTRQPIAADIRAPSSERENFCCLSGSPENILLVEFQKDTLQGRQGMSLAEIANHRGEDPVETPMDPGRVESRTGL